MCTFLNAFGVIPQDNHFNKIIYFNSWIIINVDYYKLLYNNIIYYYKLPSPSLPVLHRNSSLHPEVPPPLKFFHHHIHESTSLLLDQSHDPLKTKSQLQREIINYY